MKFFLSLLFLLIFQVSSAGAQDTLVGEEIIGIKAPSFLLNDLVGRPRPLARYRGHWVLLHFWSPFHPEAGRELTSLMKVIKEIGEPEHFMAVTVVPGESVEPVKKLILEHEVWLPVLLDEGNRIRKLYGVTEVPQTLFINPEGEFANFLDPKSGIPVSRAVGERKWYSEVAIKHFRRLATGVEEKE